MSKRVLWQEMRRDEIAVAAQEGAVVVVPVGAIEQHGPHLPLNTDICDSWAIARRVAERCDAFPVIVAPPIWWGMSPYHMVYPGTITLQFETLSMLISDVCTSIHTHGFKKILLLNGHGGNRDLCRALSIKLASNGVPIAAVTYWDLALKQFAEISESDHGLIGHAGELETSLQLYLQPELVDTGLIGSDLTSSVYGRFRQGVLPAGYIAVNNLSDAPAGIMGDPTTATAAKGERLVAAATAGLLRYLEEYRAL